ncbi:MAG: DUF554 domain-containing protein [Deltaproteobacteria bacterium]|nr:DUF554 domain-containing protein [Deltaproteobacteria bacterium]
MIPWGTIANVLTVIIGSAVGMALGRRFPDNVRNIVFQGLGLAVLLLGIQMALKVQQPLLLIFSILIGGIIGELCHLEDLTNRLGDLVKKKLHSRSTLITEGLVTGFLIFCAGSMTVVGAFDEGLRGDHSVLLTKALLDGFTSLALASTYGVGVLLSVVPLFIYQVGLTVLAGLFQGFFSPILINELTAVGGLLLLGIGINLLDIKNIKIMNFLPALAVNLVLVKIFA